MSSIMKRIKNFPYLLLGKPFWNLLKVDRPTLPRFRDFTALFLLLPVFYYVKFLMKRMYHRIGTFLLRRIENVQFFCSLDFKKRISRFKQEGWEMLNHSVSAIWAFIYFRNFRFWFPNQKNIWSIDPANKPLEFQFKLFYLYQLVFYSELTLSLVVKKGLKDLPLFLHHFFTLVLIVASYLNGYADIGVLVVILHDISDIFVSLSKMFNYVKFTRFSEIVLFPSLLVAWATCKLYYFPVYIIRTCMFDSWSYTPELHSTWIHSLTWFLVGLLVLHFFWFFKFLKLYKKILKGFFRDLREWRNRNTKAKEE